MTNHENLNDEDLVGLVRDKDPELYAVLMRRYQAKLLRYARYLVRSNPRAEDVVQEAFIKAFINLKGFNVKKKFSSWIYRIVHNEAVNQLKKHSKETRLTEAIAAQLASKEPQPDEVFENGEVRRALKQRLEELPLKYRSPLALFYLEERSYDEISDTLRIPIGTVGTHINRGKKLLRALCERKNNVRK